MAAARVLSSVLKSRRTLDDTLLTEADYSALKGPDRAFARTMVSAALRHLGRIDAVLLPLVDRPADRIGIEVASLLRIGAAQFWVLDTPDHAAVGETVAAAKRWPATAPATGLVNAVLRKAAGMRDMFDQQPAFRTWPDWLRADFASDLGEADAERLAAVQLETPDLHLTAKSDDAADAIAAAVAGRVIAAGSVALAPGAVTGLAGYEAGDWWVQDGAAALAARLLAVRPGETVFDLCAAPGGKTLQLAAAGADIIAVDRSKARLKRLKENLARTGLGERVEVIAAEIEAWSPPVQADAILLDAPCSALGTLRRHPEGAWIKSAKDVARFPAVQARFLKAAAQWLKPGGRLVYCVCTPRAEEGRDVIAAGLASGTWQRMPITAHEVPAFEHGLTETGDLLTLPAEGQRPFSHDAFFIARLQKL
ncbi:MAG: transcription antitermination factor NusB [Pseudomonadota bacterium]